MADKRMFTKKVTDDDNFMSLSSSAQALYLHLSMSADDDGFCNQVAVSMFKAHAGVQDLQALLEKRYIYQFENGVIVIKHWRMANALRKDRYTPTAFQEELAQLELKDNGSYTWLPDGCQVVAKCLPQDRLDKDRLDICEPDAEASSSKKKKHQHGEFKKVLLTDEEHQKLIDEFGSDRTERAIRFLDEYIAEKGYKSKSHYLAIRRWVFDAIDEKKAKKSGGMESSDDEFSKVAKHFMNG